MKMSDAGMIFQKDIDGEWNVYLLEVFYADFIDV